METGPCRHCGLPVIVDDAPFLAVWSDTIKGMSPQQIYPIQEHVEGVMRMLAPYVSHKMCVDDFRERGNVQGRKRDRENRLARYRKAFPFQDSNRFDEIPFTTKRDVMTQFHVCKQSITLVSESGRGKTRLAWALIEQPFLDGLECRVFSHTGLKGAMHKATAKGAGHMAALVDKLCKVDVLLLDDLGKADMARGDQGLQIEEVTFQILDARLGMKGVRTILTSNDDGETLTSRMTPDRGRPLHRRIQELTKVFTG